MSITAVPSAILPNPIEPTTAPTSGSAVAAGGSSDALADLPASPSQTPQAQAVSTATTSAAIRQAALAPLLADLAQAATLPNLPAPVQAAITQVLAAQTPIDPPPTAADLQAATTASGLFLEAQLATGAPPSTSDLKAALLVTQQVLKTWLDSAATATPATQPPGASPTATQGAPPPSPAAQTATAQTAATQTPAAIPPATPPQAAGGTSPTASPATPALATLIASAPLEAPSAQTPTLVAPAATPSSPTPQAQTPAAVQSASAAAVPAANIAAGPDLQASPAAVQIAGTLATTIAAPSSSLVAAQASNAIATPAPATAPPPPPPAAGASLPAALPTSAQASVNLYAQALARVPLSDLLGAAPQDDSEGPTAASTAPQALSAAPKAAPAPPYAGGPTTGQKPTQPGLSADAEPAVIARRLLTETGGAIARQELHQVASLPTADAGQRPTEVQSRWMFELPFATPQGSAVAQFEISRDGGGGAASAGESTWRARFTLDLEPLGPVHAQVAVAGARAGVTLWAERPTAAAALQAQQAVLSAGLEDAAFAANVSVHSGAPTRAAPPSGRFLDQAS